ncbi:MAG: U32 family peptidase [Ruminococcus sp.]|nr:U32 family peptidase [Ruminococcus sp.]
MAEVLSPCGSYETLEAVLKTGTDAVYVGSENFSARASAHNFTRQELERAVYECHKRGVKLYQAINTLVTDDELGALEDELMFACKAGVDGLIVQDLCVIEYVKSFCPDMPIHASTQMSVHTKQGVLISGSLGLCRVVLARELPADIISELSSLGLETEVFVHGALCMSVSGQCYMSAVIGGRSANRGMCAQACRLPVSAIKGSGRYDLSLKDMSFITKAARLKKMGVSSLKIEGRMKRPEYAAAAANALNTALSGGAPDIGTLEDVFSRGGFTDGYFYHKTGREMFGIRTKENAAAANDAYPKIHELYRYEHKYDTVDFSLYAHMGEGVRLTVTDGHGNSVSVTGQPPEQAKSRAADIGYVKKSLSKLGGTIYDTGSITADMDDGLMISASSLNALRRSACDELDKVRAAANTKVKSFSVCDIPTPPHKSSGRQGIRVFVSDISKLSGVDIGGVELVCIPPELTKDALSLGIDADRLAAVGDRFTFDESAETERIKAAKANGVNRLIATNIAHIGLAKELDMRVSGDWGLNVTNSVAAKSFAKMGLDDITLSFELKASKLAKISSPVPVSVFAYGRLPLMLTVNCPIRQAVGCKNCKRRLFDRTGREFMVKCSRDKGYVEILNSEVLIIDRIDDFSFADSLSLYFYDETPGEINDIISAYRQGREPDIKNKTHGLYYRGIK